MKHILYLFLLLIMPAISQGQQRQTTSISVIKIDTMVYLQQEVLVPISVKVIESDIANTKAKIEKTRADLFAMEQSLQELERLRRQVAIKEEEVAQQGKKQ